MIPLYFFVRVRARPRYRPHTGERCWPLQAGVWRAIAPLVKPWCAEGEVPTAANLNLYRGWRSCVGWHRDDEPLFGECSEAKLIVSVSLGSSAHFRWKGQSCPDDEAHLCWLGHGDIPVMDGQCQDDFLHRTDPGREQEWINVTFRWVKRHVASCPFPKAGVACCLAACAQLRGMWRMVWLLFGALCVWGASFGSVPFVYKAWVTSVCLLLDTPFGRRWVGASPL